MKLLGIITSLFFITACDPTVHFNKVEMKQNTDGDVETSALVSLNSGTLKRSSENNGEDKIVFEGTTYQIGKFSSAQAYSFIQSQPLGSEVSIKFSGSFDDDTGYSPDPQEEIEVVHLVKLETSGI